MKIRVTFLVLAVVAVALLAACSVPAAQAVTPLPTAPVSGDPSAASTALPVSAQDTRLISPDDALDAAADHAGFSASEVTPDSIELEEFQGVPVYEVDFFANGREYDYLVDALNGDVLNYGDIPARDYYGHNGHNIPDDHYDDWEGEHWVGDGHGHGNGHGGYHE